MKDKRTQIKDDKFKANKSTRNKMWAKYTEDVINRGLRSKISFELYCGRLLTPAAYTKQQFK